MGRLPWLLCGERIMIGARSGNTGKIMGYTELIHSGGLGWVVKLVKSIRFSTQSRLTEPTEHLGV